MGDFVSRKARPAIFNLKPYIPGKPVEEVKRELGLNDVIKLASNENPLGPSPRAVAEIEKALQQINQYPDSNCYYLKQKLAAFCGVDASSILVGNGSDELLLLLAQSFIDPGDQVIYAHPSFMEYEFTAKIMGADCIEVPLANFKHDLPAILKAINEKTKIVFVCNPNNPTGTIVSEKETDAFMAQVPADVLVVFDEAYYEYVESPDYVSGVKYLSEGRNVLVLRTFSKIYGLAALRVGYALTTPAIAQAIERVTEPFNVNLLAQLGALGALGDQEYVKTSREVNLSGKRYLYQAFKEMGLFYVESQANFIFVDTGINSQEVFKSLLNMGVIVRSGDIFGHPTFIRVTIGSERENKRFIDSLKKVLNK